ncbi:hypothetical protein VP1G_02081 [Cytospora mali]|uniref:Uncharacterized protein n=1 Tax=Cytospora mali TaxID=578113 RepID=A0A194UST3_CYTMA|nr:hypothetical protein VP1G_02081 [Valsa mali var. pyri (nom. inval.)]
MYPNSYGPTYNNVAGGEAVVFLKTVDGDNYYCCGTPLLGDDTAECFYNQSSFTLGDGELMFGYAGLEDATRTSSAGSSSATDTSSASSTGTSTTNISPSSATVAVTTTAQSQPDAAVQTSDPQCQGDIRDVKVGVGVGVPLGVTALLAVAWALWERRKRLSTKPTVAAPDGDLTHLNPLPASYYYEMVGQVGHAEPVQHAPGTVAELHAFGSSLQPEYNNLGGGDNIIFVGGTNAESYRYCCGSVVAYNDTVACEKNQSSFSLGDSRILFGYAALENASISSAMSTSTSTSSTTSVSTCTTLGPSYTAGSTNGCHSENDKARVAVGIGVPLGIIALLAVAWGLWERWKRINTKPATVVAGGDIIQNHHHNSWSYHMQSEQQVQGPPAELHSEMSPVEIANSDRGQ